MANYTIKDTFKQLGIKILGWLRSNCVNNCTSTSQNLPLAASQGKALQDQITTLNSNLDANLRRTRKNITSSLGNLSKAVAEQNLGKYGYSIGDYFTGASGYTYHLADMDPYYGGYANNSVIGTHHIGILVDTKANTAWLSSGSVTSYAKSTLHTFLTTTALDNIKSDLTKLFGNWNSHLLSHNLLNC